MANKQILAKYVHDAVDMETRRHTLNRLRDSIIYSRKQRVNEKERNIAVLTEKHQREIQASECTIKQLEDEYSKISPKHEQKRSSMQDQIHSLEAPLDDQLFYAEWGPIIRNALLMPYVIYILCCVVLVIICYWFNSYNMLDTLFSDENFSAIIATVIGYIVLMFVFGRITYNKQKREWNKMLLKGREWDISKIENEIKRDDEEYRNTVARYKQKIDDKKNNHQSLVSKLQDEELAAKEELALAQRTYDELTPHIQTMGKQLDTMDSQLRQFYAVNLIPPDYRSLECVIAFDQMFRNDLVDTIREAVLLYKERVFRGEMVKGIENIRRDLNKLGILMSETVSVLRRIDNNTNRMSNQLVEISSNITRMNANVTGHLSTISGNISSLGSSLDHIADSQSDIASELEYSRYANDAIRANSDRMIWYAEQHRQGLL